MAIVQKIEVFPLKDILNYQGIEQPEGQNDLRKTQLMELARLNGTLRDDQMPRLDIMRHSSVTLNAVLRLD